MLYAKIKRRYSDFEQQNSSLVPRSVALTYDPWLTPYTSQAVVVGGICVVSLCFENTSIIDAFTDLGIASVGATSSMYVNSVLTKQGTGTGIDCYINPNESRIYVNARGHDAPVNSVLRGMLVFPVKT